LKCSMRTLVVLLHLHNTGDPAVSSQLLQLLSCCASGQPGVCAYVGGILWELAASTAAAEQLLAAGAVAALLQVVRDTAAVVGGGASSKKKKKSGKKGDGKGGKVAEKDVKNSSGSGSKGKDGKAAAGAAAGEGADAPAFVLLQDPPAAAEVALCNATGATCERGRGVPVGHATERRGLVPLRRYSLKACDCPPPP
jgi:hypothetical protein